MHTRVNTPIWIQSGAICMNCVICGSSLSGFIVLIWFTCAAHSSIISMGMPGRTVITLEYYGKASCYER